MADATTGKLDIGKVISGTFGVLRVNPANFLIVAGVLLGLPSVASAALQLVTGGDRQTLVFNPIYWLIVVMGVIGTFVAYVSLMWLTGEALSGRKASAMEAFAAAGPRILPLVGVAILQGLGIMLGFILLVVPGIILAVMWSVALPALVVGRSPILASFKASADLTEGNRWRVFGLMVLYLIILFVIGGVIGVAGMASVVAGQPGPVFILVGAALNIVTYLLSMVGVTVLYSELRNLKHGAGAESLAKVFD